MNELPNTVAEAQERLHAIRSSTDPRWVEQQLAPQPPDDASVHWEIVLAGCIGTFIAGAIVTVAVFYAFPAKADTAYEIVAYPAGKDLREDRPNLIVVSGPYGREECRIAIASVKLANGSRLRCDAVEERRTR